MRNLASSGSHDPGIRGFANSYTGDSLNKLLGYDAKVRRVYRYRSENQELIRTPEFMLSDLIERGYLEGDCDDISTFSASVVRAMGITCRFVAIRTDPTTTDYKHVFIEAFANGGWYRVDATVSNKTEMVYYGERMTLNV